MSKQQAVLARIERMRTAGELTDARRLCQFNLAKRFSLPIQLELGVINGLMGLFSEAVNCFEKILRRFPENAKAHFYLGKAHAMQGAFELAMDGFEKAIQFDPNYREAWLSMAISNRDHGRFIEAAQYSRTVIDRWPEYGKAYQVLSSTRKFDGQDSDFSRIINGLTVSGMTPVNYANVRFAAAKVYDDLGEFDLAFECLERANATIQALRNYNVDNDERLMVSMRQFFTRDFFAAAAGNEGAGSNAIFIVGMPRSGTTLVEQILSCHNQVQAMGEMEYLRRAVWGVSKKMIGTPFPSNVSELGMDDLSAMAGWYLDRFSVAEGKSFTDKLPSNFMLIGMIRLLFPAAKVIHCRRDRIDTCLACFRQYFYGQLDYTYSLSDMGRYWLAYDQLMQHWHQVLPGFIHDVQYESLVSELPEQVRQLLGFCDLEFEPGCLEPHKAKRSVQTASVVQVRQPVYKSSIAKWRGYEAHLKPLFDVIGRPE